MDEESVAVSDPQENDETGTERTPVRYPSLKDQNKIPGYLYIDEAIDRIGLKNFETSWGKGDVWSQLPYKPDDKLNQFTRSTLKWSGSRYDLVPSKVSAKFPREQLSATSALFKNAIDILFDAMSRRLLRASRLYDNGDVKEINEEQFGLWQTRFRPIFLTGRGCDDRDRKDSRFIVLIEGVSFEEFLSEKPRILAINTKLATALIEVIDERCHFLDYTPVKARLFELLNEALPGGEAMSERYFTSKIWDQLDVSGKAGRPSAAAAQGFVDDWDELRRLLVRTIANFRNNRSKIIPS